MPNGLKLIQEGEFSSSIVSSSSGINSSSGTVTQDVNIISSRRLRIFFIFRGTTEYVKLFDKDKNAEYSRRIKLHFWGL